MVSNAAVAYMYPTVYLTLKYKNHRSYSNVVVNATDSRLLGNTENPLDTHEVNNTTYLLNATFTEIYGSKWKSARLL